MQISKRKSKIEHILMVLIIYMYNWAQLAVFRGCQTRLVTNFLCLPDRLICLSRIDQAEKFA